MENRKVINDEHIRIDGLTLIGYNKQNKVTHPLSEHIHENCIEIVVLIKGTESYTVDNKLFTVHGGEAFITLPDEIHSNGNNPQGISEFIWMQLNMKDKTFLGLNEKLSAILKTDLLSLNKRIIKVDKKTINLTQEVFAAVENKEWLYAQGALISFCSKILSSGTSPSVNHTVETAIKYIDENIYSNLTIDEISSHCNVCVSTLQHNFLSVIGKTPLDYINTKKIEIAKSLLKSGQSITNVAMSLSFNSSNYFSTVFKKYTLHTPHEFQRLTKPQ